MSAWWQVLLGIAGGLVLLWLVLLLFLWSAHRANPDAVRFHEALRLLPDLVRLLKRLSGDATLPRGVRVRLILLLIYLALPFDLVPDFVPVLGYADDAIIVALVLRSVVRRTGSAGLERHWPGTSEGLSSIYRLAGIKASD